MDESIQYVLGEIQVQADAAAEQLPPPAESAGDIAADPARAAFFAGRTPAPAEQTDAVTPDEEQAEAAALILLPMAGQPRRERDIAEQRRREAKDDEGQPEDV